MGSPRSPAPLKPRMYSMDQSRHPIQKTRFLSEANQPRLGGKANQPNTIAFRRQWERGSLRAMDAANGEMDCITAVIRTSFLMCMICSNGERLTVLLVRWIFKECIPKHWRKKLTNACSAQARSHTLTSHHGGI